MSNSPGSRPQLDASFCTEEEHGYSRALNLIKAHAPWVFPTIFVFSSFLGGVILWGFTGHIGRRDIFLESLSSGPSLLILSISCFFVYIILVSFFLLSCIWVAHTMKELKGKWSDSANTVIFFVAETPKKNEVSSGRMVAGLAGMFALNVLAFSGGFCWLFFILLSVSVSFCIIPKWDKYLIYLNLSCIFFSFLNFSFSYFYLKAFGEVDKKSPEIILTLLLVSCLPLFPVFLFYSAKEKIAQMFGVVTGVVSWNIGLFVLVSGMFAEISTSSMVMLGVADQKTSFYAIDLKQYPRGSLDELEWEVVPIDENKYKVKAFSLYAYGAINLLCPARLAHLLSPEKQNFEKIEIKNFTNACIPFPKGDIRKLADQQHQG